MPHTISADGVRIHYQVEGAGPPVALLHGMGGSFERGWRQTGWAAALVEAGYQVIGIDARGVGASDHVTDAACFRDGPAVADVCAVLDAAGVGRAHLIGYSMGAGHALRVGLERPARVRALVLGGLGGIALAMAGVYWQSVEVTRARLLNGARLVGGRLADRDAVLGPYAAAYFAALQEDTLIAGNLEALALPVLLVVGEHDTAQGDFAALSVTAMLERRIAGARRLVLPGVNHATAVPDQRFKDAALAFLHEHEPRR